MRFDGADSDVNITPDHGEVEFDLWRWATLDEAVALIVPFKRAVYEQVAAVIGPMIRAHASRADAQP